MAGAAWEIDHFHVYLYGRLFTLYTDHWPVETLRKVHQKTLKRLQQQMLEYSFKIRYKKGLKNTAVDALSRNFIEAMIKKPSEVIKEMRLQWKDIVQLQKEDAECMAMRAFMLDVG